MKPYVKLFAAALAVGSIVACGAAGDSEEIDSELGDPPSEESEVSLDTQAVSANGEEAMVSREGSQQDILLGKKCWATCTVIDLAPNDANYCPVTIGGYGNTTFLGGCNKACTRAKADAASKLPAGCTLNNCNFTGC